MFQYSCLNPIAQIGLDGFDGQYEKTDDVNAADVVLVRSAAMHDMELSDKLCAIARAGAGVNNIPLDKCADQGIVVFNTPGANANGVKEMVVSGMLLAARDIAGGMQWVKDNADDENISKSMEKAKKNFAGTELKGKKLGVIGLGAIGVLVANVARHFGMEIYGVDPFLSVNNALSLSRDVTVVKSYDELYQVCDYITIHVPYIPETKGMLNKEAFDQMKDGVVILNFARDLLVNDDDMKAALESGKVRRYVTDFPTKEIAGVKGAIYRAILTVGCVPYKAYVELKAICKTIYRVNISHKHLLEWMTSEDAEKQSKTTFENYYKMMAINVIFGILAILLGFDRWLLTIIGILWITTPYIMYKISKVPENNKKKIAKEDEIYLKEIAQRTWQFFKDYLTAENNYMIPDNYQEDRKQVVVPRTSSTNIGLSMLAIISSYDLGFEGLESSIDRLKKLINVVYELPKWNGHLYNWYNIKTKKPLIPRYISTVDSGNFIGYLYVLKQWLEQELF